jgi:hypothetical protein
MPSAHHIYGENEFIFVQLQTKLTLKVGVGNELLFNVLCVLRAIFKALLSHARRTK